MRKTTTHSTDFDTHDGLFINVFDRKLKPFNYFIGGRGIGKTYSALWYFQHYEIPFLYMRNTIKQIDKCKTLMGNPFKRINKDFGTDIRLDSELDHAIINKYIEGRDEPVFLGYAVALSDFEAIRGIDLSDVDYALFDEFIQRKGKLQYNQFEAFTDFYETAARNREILGEEPFRVLLCTNSQKVGSEILAGFGLIPHLERLIYKGGGVWRDGTTHLEYFPKQQISELKGNTALYRALGSNNKLSREFLDNEFAHDSFTGIGAVPLREYTGYCVLDEFYFYRHKSQRQFYVCRVPFTLTEPGQKFSSIDNFPYFMRRYGVRLKDAYIEGRLKCSEYFIKITLAELWKL